MIPVSPVQAYLASSATAVTSPMAPAAPGRISPAELQNLGASSGASGAAEPPAFGRLLDHFVTEVNGRQLQAREAVNDLLAGKNVSLHQTVIAMEEAQVSFQLMVEVRNKLLESYQELMRMQL
ncbi:flagellar hook-basal body complex protein FliE [Fontisphaera persica]|uniref:flagellar hook-basal body complex protein FliE n=1 Tax=Fontisphaera persica TaxID=2974023 RepID=UPI0024C098B4|nr:flagellar hook-basal body complex protein FliE [Fontisphaera persica]WCJ58231.1 flagellar hook-basal body complex protein FliE [Fontisphaera persica]